MKLFNVHLEVQISFAGELQEAPAPPVSEESFSDLTESQRPGDDPMKLQAKILDKLYGKPVVVPGGYFLGAPEGVSMSQNVKIAADSFEELQKILAKFHDVAESLQVPV